MPDTCPVCQTPLAPGATTCPVCPPTPPPVMATEPVALSPADSPAPDRTPEPTTNHSLGVLIAFLMPIVATVVIVSLLGVIGFGLFALGERLLPKPAPPHPFPMAVTDRPTSPLGVMPPAPASTPTPVSTLQGSPNPLRTPTTPATPAKPAIVLPAPELTGFSPAVAGKGLILSLDGERLTGVNQVLLISSAGAKSVSVKPIFARNANAAIRIPDAPFASDDIIIAAISPGGVAVLIDVQCPGPAFRMKPE